MAEKSINRLSFHLKPLTMFLSNLTIKKILTGVLTTTLAEANHFGSEEDDLDKLQLLKKNFLAKPLIYYKNTIKQTIGNMIQFKGTLDNLSICFYDSQPFLANDHIMMAEFGKIVVEKSIPDFQDFGTIRGVWNELSITVNKIDIETITVERTELKT